MLKTLFIKYPREWKPPSIFDKSIKWEPVGCNDILPGDHYHNQQLSFISDDRPPSPPSRPADQNCTSVIFPSNYSSVGCPGRLLTTNIVLFLFLIIKNVTLYPSQKTFDWDFSIWEQ